MSLTLEFLGTGTSGGVPIIGCTCAVCTSADPHDSRLRSSALIRIDGKTILIDTSPDLRQQLLRAKPDRIDGVLYTHMHSDHTAGLDDLRPFNYRQEERIPTWVPANAINDLRQRFGYALEPIKGRYGVIPSLDVTVIDVVQPFEIAGVTVTPIPVMHGKLPILGYRFGNLAYITDILTLPEESWPLLDGVEVLVTTALKLTENPGHMCLPEAIAFAKEVGARQTWFSHIGHEMGKYADINPTLPDGMELAYDGLVIEA
ncbi:MAG: MBL fold metallo-hydrolase [Thermomicrobiales bacterium]|nr:MBL fold metallo-hydrolase [Thermomicrobiales bacterium]